MAGGGFRKKGDDGHGVKNLVWEEMRWQLWEREEGRRHGWGCYRKTTIMGRGRERRREEVSGGLPKDGSEGDDDGHACWPYISSHSLECYFFSLTHRLS